MSDQNLRSSVSGRKRPKDMNNLSNPFPLGN
jgi:hypothetical protein